VAVRQRPENKAASAIGLDTGGTFTDVVAWRDGRRVAFKVPSTPRAPAEAVLAGLARAGAGPGTRVRHGSTVATNALLERKGARVTLVTTAGFEDVLEIGRQDRPDIYALQPTRIPPLVPRERRIGARERLAAGGAEMTPLTAGEIASVVRRARATRPEAIAVGLLHAWSAPAHEQRLARALAHLHVPVTAASELVPEIREYERLATTVANAFLSPRVGAYLRQLADGAGGAEIEIVLSHGGTAPPEQAAREPVRQLFSGPAAGLRAALETARACGFERALTLDVGGTSTDCAFLGGRDTGRDGLPRRRGREVAGVPVLLPTLDVHTVGAGGGSIARADAGGVLRVGPESAGADPGPACYGRGGPATVTDALVVLGAIAGDSLAGGALKLDRAAARTAMTKLARALRLPTAERAAEGVLRVVESHMANALRKVSVECGEDPRGAALVAFGGAGGLHACALAEALGTPAAIWPRDAGVLCALGALSGGSRRERSRSVLADATDTRRLARAIAQLEREVRAAFPASRRRRVRLEHRAEVRARGQAHEVTVAALPLAGLAARFHDAHERRYGFADRGAALQVVTLEVGGWLDEPLPAERARPRDRAQASARAIDVWVGGRRARARLWRRDDLGVGAAVAGPAVIADDGATLWVAPGWSARVHASGAMVLAKERER
jgi:N-methylhydantoinase A